MRSTSTATRAIGVAMFVLALVGYVAFGWRFGDGVDSPIALGLALVAVAVAVGATLRDRL
ncbi:hypothetical protein [Halorussus marinus]|uniref:hypothetical protein n=1 Tax=Halorussus marinus TaxID=2505976 RepID=UPI00106E8523|nr:hypothetical protein [Halorussus marinus]